jgi:hypothetical protein
LASQSKFANLQKPAWRLHLLLNHPEWWRSLLPKLTCHILWVQQLKLDEFYSKMKLGHRPASFFSSFIRFGAIT